MNNNETTNQENNEPDIEDLIINDILSSHKDDLKSIPKTNLETIIREKVIKADYLNEGWPVNYAVMRIREAIEHELRIREIIEDKTSKDEKFEKLLEKHKILNYLSWFSIALGVIGLFYFGLILGGLAMALGALAKEGKQKFATLGIVVGSISLFGAIIASIFLSFSRGGSYITSTSLVLLFYVIFLSKPKQYKKDEAEAIERIQSTTKK